MNSKRTLERLRNAYEGHIYLTFHNQEEYDNFLKAVEKEGYRFGQYLPTEHIGELWDIISLGYDKQLAFCGYVSHMAYKSGNRGIYRIDYVKYATGDDFFAL